MGALWRFLNFLPWAEKFKLEVGGSHPIQGKKTLEFFFPDFLRFLGRNDCIMQEKHFFCLILTFGVKKNFFYFRVFFFQLLGCFFLAFFRNREAKLVVLA